MALHSLTADQRSTFRLFPLLALVTFGALLLAGLTALPAAAHSALTSSTPEDGAELEEAPDAVVLTFNENIIEVGTDIVISGPDGEDAAGGETEIDGAEVSRSLAGDLAAGEYSVTWRAVSADGHPIDGTLSFTLTEGAATGTGGAGAEETTEGADEAASESPSEAPDDATASEDAGADAEQNGTDGSEGDQAEADASDAADAQAGAGAADDGGTSGGQIALFVVIALAVIGGVTALIVRMRRQQ